MEKIKAFGICLYKIVNRDKIEILLCKSVKSKKKWGLLKGLQENGETDIQTAIREFLEESSIQIEKNQLEEYFEQQNESKDIGIWLVNTDTIGQYNTFFINESLKEKYICSENSQVRFFNIKQLPIIKKKQKILVQQIIEYFNNFPKKY